MFLYLTYLCAYCAVRVTTKRKATVEITSEK